MNIKSLILSILTFILLFYSYNQKYFHSTFDRVHMKKIVTNDAFDIMMSSQTISYESPFFCGLMEQDPTTIIDIFPALKIDYTEKFLIIWAFELEFNHIVRDRDLVVLIGKNHKNTNKIFYKKFSKIELKGVDMILALDKKNVVVGY